MRIDVPTETVKSIISMKLRQKGGLVALAIPSVSKAVDELAEETLGLHIESESPLAQVLIKRGLLAEPKEG